MTIIFFLEKIFLKNLFFKNRDYSKTKTDINAWSSALERGEQILFNQVNVNTISCIVKPTEHRKVVVRIRRGKP